ncbi:MAG: hypothetical protein ABMB14_24550 [Myxococcota bacterium]
MFGTEGLTRVRDEHLVALLRAIHRDELPCPMDHVGFATAGFLGIADHLEHLRGLDKAGVIAVITAVLAERRARAGR